VLRPIQESSSPREPASSRHNLSLTGGSSATNYTGSLNWQDTEGIFQKSNLRTVTGRMNMDATAIIEVPAAALTRFNRQPAVWIVDPSSRTVSMQNVEVLRFDQETVAISQGLDTGEIVVTGGVQALHPGQQVRLLGSQP